MRVSDTRGVFQHDGAERSVVGTNWRHKDTAAVKALQQSPIKLRRATIAGGVRRLNHLASFQCGKHLRRFSACESQPRRMPSAVAVVDIFAQQLLVVLQEKPNT